VWAVVHVTFVDPLENSQNTFCTCVYTYMRMLMFCYRYRNAISIYVGYIACLRYLTIVKSEKSKTVVPIQCPF